MTLVVQFCSSLMTRLRRRGASARRASRSGPRRGWRRVVPRERRHASRSRPRRRSASVEPGWMMSRFVPIAANACSTRAFAPAPMAIIAMTAPTPMTMPERRQERAQLVPEDRAERHAERLQEVHAGALPHVERAADGSASVAARLALSSDGRCPSFIDDDARRERRDVRLVRDEDDRDPRRPTAPGRAPSPRRSCASRGRRSARRRGSTLGSLTIARAIATRCCCPPESWFGWCSRRVAEADALERRARALPAAPSPDAPRTRAAARRSRARSCARAG